jgi:hypothetical protein
MTGKEGGANKNMSPLSDDPVLSNNSDTKIKNYSKTSAQNEDGLESEDLDEFGLPILKIVVNSRPPSSRSDSFASARSSLDEPLDNEEENADVEDNDVEDDVNGLSDSVMEWPRLSRSTLPTSGHVKSSPFHVISPKPAEKNVIYADRAKDLVKVAPVSNSIFKRQESTIEKPILRSASMNAMSSVNNEAGSQNETRSQSQPPETPKLDSEKPKEVEPKVTISTNVSHLLNPSKSSPLSANSPSGLFEDAHDALNPSGASEWSHQLAVAQTELHGSPEKSRKSLDTEDWQTMEAFAVYDIYDDDGRLVAKQFVSSDDEQVTKGGAGKGYTRMNQDEDIPSADSMDENTQYLFPESLDDENAKTPLSQMQATKELLTEGQRIAYVGLCKLTMVEMLRDVSRVRFKENRAAYESMTLWSQKMMIRLFSHMDISSDGCSLLKRADDRTSYD